MKCSKPECQRESKWNISARPPGKGIVLEDELYYCSTSCVREDSQRRLKLIPSDQTEKYSTPEPIDPSQMSSSEESETRSEFQDQRKDEPNKKEKSIMQNQNDSSKSQNKAENDDWSGTENFSSGKKTNAEHGTNLPVQYFEPAISSSQVKSPSLNMINESITQLNSIRKDLHKDYQSRRMEPDQALLSENAVERIKTICMVNSQIVATMKLGLEIVKAMGDK